MAFLWPGLFVATLALSSYTTRYIIMNLFGLHARRPEMDDRARTVISTKVAPEGNPGFNFLNALSYIFLTGSESFFDQHTTDIGSVDHVAKAGEIHRQERDSLEHTKGLRKC